MHRYILSRGAIKSLRRTPKDRVDQIMRALDGLAATEKPIEHHNVTAMKGEWLGLYRIRIGSYRAVFTVNPDPDAVAESEILLLSVEAIGTRGGIYG